MKFSNFIPFVLILATVLLLGYSSSNSSDKSTVSVWDKNLTRQAIVVYASFDFSEYFDIIPQIAASDTTQEILIFTPETTRIENFLNKIHQNQSFMDSVIDMKFGNHFNICRSKELYRSFMEKMIPILNRGNVRIIPYGNLNEAYAKSPHLGIDSVKKLRLEFINSVIQNSKTNKILIIQPEGFVEYSSILESKLLSLNMPLTKVLFVPLKEKEKSGHEYLRRQNPLTNLDNISYSKLRYRGNSKFSYFDLQANSKKLPLTSKYYDYLMLVKDPKYLPVSDSGCCVNL